MLAHAPATGATDPSSARYQPVARINEANDPLSIVRRALGAEHQLIRVSDSDTNETYDVTLSRTAPYASPCVFERRELVNRPAEEPSWRGRRSRWARVHEEPDAPESSLRAYIASFWPTPRSRSNSPARLHPAMGRNELPGLSEGEAAAGQNEPGPLEGKVAATPPAGARVLDETGDTPAPPIAAYSLPTPLPSSAALPDVAPPLFLGPRVAGDALEERGCDEDTHEAQPVTSANTSVLADGGHASPLGIVLPDGSRPPRPSIDTRPSLDVRRARAFNTQRRFSTAASMSSMSSGGHAVESATFEEEMAQNADALRRSRRAKGTGEAQRRPQSPRQSMQPPWSPREGAVRPIGTLIGEDHVNYVLMYHMLTGIRIAVSRCEARAMHQLTEADFSAKYKFTFDIIGNELRPSSSYDFKFKDYAPAVFRTLRRHFQLDTGDYLLSLAAKYILSELGSPGKSGSFFYFSHDYRFIIKTIRHDEQKFLMRILPAYYEHVVANPQSLLSQFYGLHRVKLPGRRKIHFVIMNNLFPPHRDIHEMYDLKGSIVKREQKSGKPGAVLKDMNWLRRGHFLELGPEKREIFAEQLRRDVALLQRLHIMDYSLLVGLHDMRIGNKAHLLRDALQVFQPEDDVPEPSPTSPRTSRTDVPASGMDGDGSFVSPRADMLRAKVAHADPTVLSAQTATKLPRRPAERLSNVFYRDEGGLRATDAHDRPGNVIYYLGIIDLFTQYTPLKRAEHLWKGIYNNVHQISPVAPREYGERFIRFLLRRTGDDPWAAYTR